MDLKSALGGLKDKVDDLLEKTDIDEKIVEKAGELKEKAGELLEKTDIDEKIAEKAGELKEKVTGLFGKAEEAAKEAARARSFRSRPQETHPQVSRMYLYHYQRSRRSRPRYAPGSKQTLSFDAGAPFAGSGAGRRGTGRDRICHPLCQLL